MFCKVIKNPKYKLGVKTTMKRICFFCGNMSRGGGTERMVQLISNQLSIEDGYKIFVLSKSDNNKPIFFPLDNTVHYSVLNNDKYKKILSFVKDVFLLRKYIKKNKIDIIVNVDIGMAPLGILGTFLTKTKTITWEHSNFYNNWNSKKFPLIRKFAAKFSNAFVLLTERDKKNYLENFEKMPPTYVIPNPIGKTNTVYCENSKTIISVGRLDPIKQFDIAIEVANKVFSLYPDWCWVIFGDGKERTNLESLIKKYKLENNFILKGNVDDIHKQYAAAAMYVMTSKMEGLPMVLLEAKSHKLPIISFNIMTGPSDIITDGINGFLVEQNNVEELTEKMILLISDLQIRKVFSNNSQLDIDKFDFDRIISLWKNLMDSVL